MTEETTETLYLLGEQDRIVGISGYTVRPARARREKPKVSAFTSARIGAITALRPDLVLGFSDLQADIAADLIRRGIAVLVFNQRSVEEILSMIAQLGALAGAGRAAERLLDRLERNLDRCREAGARLAVRPKLYFEEWDDPLIHGIRWVSELVEIAGAQDIFKEGARSPLARDRIIADPDEVVRRNPDVVVGSWCGKRFRPERVRERPGWSAISAVSHGHLYEIKSAEILQPGPAALTDGLDRLCEITHRVART